MEEDGAELASELWASGSAGASSVLAYPEGRAALAAARRARRLTPSAYRTASERFEEIRRQLFIVGVDDALAGRAGDLAAGLGLRGYDAVHLASALSLQADPTTLVTWDVSLGRAALEAGLQVSPSL